MKRNLLLVFFGLLSGFLIPGCGGPKTDLEKQILSLAADSVITEVEWGKLTSFVEGKKKQLENAEVDCFSDSSLRKIVLTTLSANAYPIGDERVWKKPIVKIEKAKFYLETSSSMVGYYEKPTDFRKQIVSFLTDLTLLKDIETYETISSEIYSMTSVDNVIKYEDDEALVRKMVTNTLPLGDGSEMDKIFEFLAEEANGGEVSIFVSDGIMSLSSDEIRENREINRDVVDALLRPKIKKVFRGLHDQGFALVLYAFKSVFYGKYFPYTNIPQTYDGEQRPYYIWCIGKTDVLKKFQQCVGEASGFSPLEIMELGLNKELNLRPCVFTRLKHEGVWSSAGINTLEDLEWDGVQPVQFCVGLDLAVLPEHAVTTDYLKENLEFENAKGVSLNVLEVLERDEIRNDYWGDLSPNEQQLVEDGLTHFVVFEIENMSLPSGSVTAVIDRRVDDWVTDWSTLDDRNLDSNRGKTWAFEHLISGMKEGFNAYDQRYAKFELQFNPN